MPIVSGSRPRWLARAGAGGALTVPVLAKVTADFDRISAEYGANHISGVAGSYVAELEQFCGLLDITPIVLV